MPWVEPYHFSLLKSHFTPLLIAMVNHKLTARSAISWQSADCQHPARACRGSSSAHPVGQSTELWPFAHSPHQAATRRHPPERHKATSCSPGTKDFAVGMDVTKQQNDICKWSVGCAALNSRIIISVQRQTASQSKCVLCKF